MVWVRRNDGGRISGVPYEPAAAAISAGDGDRIRTFFHARATHFFCQFVYNIFSVQPEHAFVFVVADE